MRITVVALRPFSHEGRVIETGTAFDTTVLHALRLRGQGKVSLSPRRARSRRASPLNAPLAQADVLSTPVSPDPTDETPSTTDIDLLDHVDNLIGTRELLADTSPEPPRPRRGRRRYRRTEMDVDETTELNAEE